MQCQYQSQYQEVYMYDDLNKIKTKITKKKIQKDVLIPRARRKLFVDKINHYDIFFSRSDLGTVKTIDTNNSIQKMVFIIRKNK